jgi:hypothetical protein
VNGGLLSCDTRHLASQPRRPPWVTQSSITAHKLGIIQPYCWVLRFIFLLAFMFYVNEMFDIITICIVIIAISYSICEVWFVRVCICVLVWFHSSGNFVLLFRISQGTAQLSFQLIDSELFDWNMKVTSSPLYIAEVKNDRSYYYLYFHNILLMYHLLQFII